MFRSNITALATALLSVALLSACEESKDECEKRYGTGITTSCRNSALQESELTACRKGMEEVAAPLADYRRPSFPSEEESERFCETGCRRLYNEEEVPLSDNVQFFDDAACVSDLYAACRTSCVDVIEYHRYLYNYQNETYYREAYEIPHGNRI